MLHMIALFDPNWLFIFPVSKLDDIQIHCRGLKFAGVYDTNDFKTDVLYKSFVAHPINDKHVEY